MLQRFLALVGRFRRDEGGAFLVLFGIMAIVLVATSGAVVDFTRIEQARTKAQNALDAAALGLQPHVFDTSPAWTSADFILEADKLLEERLGDSTITAEVTGATINVRNGQLILNAWIDVPTAFVALLGITQVRAGLLSEATRKRLNLEVAMV
ncbi:MAG: TadE/TadG family type IV pilus assembly protein, partial [Devosia sp.]